MELTYDFFADKKEEYLNQIKKSLRKTDGLIIYGAGGMGHLLLSFLQKNQIRVDAFCVSTPECNIDYQTGLNIYPLSHFINNNNNTFLIGSIKNKHSIKENMQKNGILTYIDMPPYIDNIISNNFLRPVLEITPKIGCAVNCRYCPQDMLIKQYMYTRNPIIEMEFKKFKICIDKVPKNTMIFFAGFVEPFLAKDTIKMMQYVAEKGFPISLATTLVGLNLDDFNIIKDIPFDDIVLHIPDKNHFSNIQITDEYLELCTCFINMNKASGERVVSSISCQCEPDMNLLSLLNKTHIPISWDLHDRAGNLPDSNLPHYTAKYGNIICGRSFDLNWNILLPNGDIVLCCMDFGLKYKLGNLLVDTYDNIVNGSAMKNLKNSLKQESSTIICRNCVFSVKT